MSSKICLGLLLLLVAVVLGGADDQSQDLSLSENNVRVVREAGNPNKKKNKRKKSIKIKRKRSKKGKDKGKKTLAKRKGRKIKPKKLKNKAKKKKRKNRKNKNKKKNRKRNRRRKGKRGQRQTSTVSAKCFTQAVTIMKVWKDVVKNFQRQNARMKSQNSTGSKKSDKKGLFAPTAFKLIDIGGGNKSNLSCGGVYGSDGAKQLANLTKTLLDCELSVNASCNTANFPQPNTTFIEGCEKSTTTFETQAKECLNKLTKSNVTDSCACWTASSLNTTLEAVRPCKASNFSKAIKAQLEKCKTAFSTCRKYEDDAVDALSACTKTKQQHTQKVFILFVKLHCTNLKSNSIEKET